MNLHLSAIAREEGEWSRYMPPVPSRWEDRGEGKCEEIPFADRALFEKAGVEALYLLAQTLDIDGRFHCETKEGLIDLILAKTSRGKPPKELLKKPPVGMAPKPLNGRQKKLVRAIRIHAKKQAREKSVFARMGASIKRALLN